MNGETLDTVTDEDEESQEAKAQTIVLEPPPTQQIKIRKKKERYIATRIGNDEYLALQVKAKEKGIRFATLVREILYAYLKGGENGH